MALINYVLAISFILTTVSTQCSTTPNKDISTDASNSKNASEVPLTRTGRIMTIFNKEPKLDAKRFGPPQDIIRSRSDRFPPPPAASGMQLRYPVTYQRHPVTRGSGPQILRRVQNNVPNGQIQRVPLNQIPHYEILKSSRYSATKNGPQLPSGKGSSYRPKPQFGGDAVVFASSMQHPNALNAGSQSAQYGLQQFKPSPNFSGNVVVRPIVEQQPKYTQSQQHQQQFKYTDQREQHNYPNQQPLLQREPFPLKPAHQASIQQPQYSYHQQAIKPGQQESLLSAKPNQHFVRFENTPERATLPLYSKSPQSHSYSVYEDEEQPIAKPAESKDAQEYLKFMSSNGYFLPKLDPNYKKIDDERDQQQYRQQQKQQQQHQTKSTYDSVNAASTYQQVHKLKQHQHQQQQQQPVKVSQLFFQDDNTSPPASATVVRNSYQAGQMNNNNNFVVNSDGQKVSKRVVTGPQSSFSTSTSTPTTSTPASASYNHYYYSSSRNRTPEPVRFEFTERDAITPAPYTHSPNIAQQRNSIAVGADLVGSGNSYSARSTARIPTSSQRTTTTAASYKYNEIKPVNEVDAEDGEDMQQAGSDFYGRVPVRPSLTVTSQEPPSEQKDTEDYCERICSNVQDDDEEIVCGSDGFMYTSEAQMECYASCLHIDVTIQGKGSCSSN